MERRHFLGLTIGAGTLGGCASLQNTKNQYSGQESSPTQQTNDEPAKSDSGGDSSDVDPTRTIKIGDVEAPPDSVPVTVGVGIEEGSIDEDQAGRLEIGFVTTDAVSIRTDFDAPMGRTLSDNETPGLILLTPSSTEYLDRVHPSMWKPDIPEDNEWQFKATAYEEYLSENRILVSELDIWADHQYDAYFEPGHYRFSHTFWVNDDPVEWSFTLEVTNPE